MFGSGGYSDYTRKPQPDYRGTYKEPLNPDLLVDTEKLTVSENADLIISELQAMGLVYSI